MSRRLRTVVVALCVMLAVTGCEGPPRGAKGIVKDLAALEIMNTPPPDGVRVAYDDYLGLDGIEQFNPPVVMVVYTTSASPTEVCEFYLSAYPEYDFGRGWDGIGPCSGLYGKDASSADEVVYFDVDFSVDPPEKGADEEPEPGLAPPGADLYVTVDAAWFPANG